MKQYSRKMNSGAFTLVEILASLTVLALIGIIIAQITKAAIDTTRISNRSVDATAQARISFDRIRLDVESLLRRQDVDFVANNNVAGDDILRFLSEVVSSGVPAASNRGVSFIGYRVAPTANRPGIDGNPRSCLLRAGKPVSWSDTSIAGLDSNGLPVFFSGTSFPYVFQDTDYDVLGPGVFRMVVGFRLYPDGDPVTLEGGGSTATGTSLGQLVYQLPMRSISPSDGSAAVLVPDLKRIGALVVGLVVMNEESANILNNAQITSLISAFADPVSETPVELWSPVADGLASDASLSTIPLTARQSVRVYQKAFQITLNRGQL
jgi:type II secretory pathway pseudopilin PulG